MHGFLFIFMVVLLLNQHTLTSMHTQQYSPVIFTDPPACFGAPAQSSRI